MVDGFSAGTALAHFNVVIYRCTRLRDRVCSLNRLAPWWLTCYRIYTVWTNDIVWITIGTHSQYRCWFGYWIGLSLMSFFLSTGVINRNACPLFVWIWFHNLLLDSWLNLVINECSRVSGADWQSTSPITTTPSTVGVRICVWQLIIKSSKHNRIC